MPRLLSSWASRFENPARASVGVVAVEADEVGPLGGLGGLDEGEEFDGVEAEDRVEVGGAGLQVATVGEEGGLDGVLEDEFGRLHAATPGMGSSPVTAAVMRAWRCSTRRSIWTSRLLDQAFT